MSKPLSIRDVAKRAGVSPSAVSFFINGRRGLSVVTRNHIEKVIRETGYKPDPRMARLLRTVNGKGARMIAFLVNPAVYDFIAHNDGYYSHRLHLIQEAVSKQGGYLLLANSKNDLNKRGDLRCVAEGLVDGLITDILEPEAIRPIASRLPVVVFNWEINVSGVDAVAPHVKRAAIEQVRYLLQLGHRSIACFRVWPAVGWRDETFWTAYQEIGRTEGLQIPPPFLEPIRFGLNEHPQAIRSFLDRVLNCGQPPTAILTYDGYAGEIIRQLAERGIAVPRDMSIVGYDDFVGNPPCAIPLTTYRQNFELMAETAVRLLLERMAAPQLAGRVVHVEGQALVRQSSGPCTETPAANSNPA